MSLLSKLKPSNHCLRPSKTFQFDLLEKELAKIKGEIGIDAAAQNMKNRRMFKTEKYIGIDISLPFLQAGIRRHGGPSTNTFGILGDLAKLEKLPEGIADAVVSTNTLYILKGTQRTAAVEHLCRLTSPCGTLICDAAVGEELNEILAIAAKNFGDIKIIYTDNIFSRAYERMFEKNGYLGSHPVAGSKPFLLLSWFISRLEYMTQFFKSLSCGALIICAKKLSDKKQPFDISHLPLIETSIYNLTD